MACSAIHEGQTCKWIEVSNLSIRFISYIGREYQDMKLNEINDGNVRKDTEHLKVKKNNQN